MTLKTNVHPSGKFIYAIHKPAFNAANFRETDRISSLGPFLDGTLHDNRLNFPPEDVIEPAGDWIYEIPNSFPFRGTTYIASRWAKKKAETPESIGLPAPSMVSLSRPLEGHGPDQFFRKLPMPLLLALAVTSQDPDDLVRLAKMSCDFVFDADGQTPKAVAYCQAESGRGVPDIKHHELFESVANNYYLPDVYKKVMVLKPGVQGASEIVGEWRDPSGTSHVFEYLRRNSYIPWGHYAANMADDAVRYRIEDLSLTDMTGLRHLYYQRTIVRFAEQLGEATRKRRLQLSAEELEAMRQKIVSRLKDGAQTAALPFDRTLWGWNFGFDYAPSRYRLHASHQQIHQQYALIPQNVPLDAKVFEHAEEDDGFPAYACGDLIQSFIQTYHRKTGADFFEALIQAVKTNERVDGRSDKEKSLIVYQDERVMVYVPKAQTSQWELQVMPLAPVGNILEADTAQRQSLDKAIWIAVRTLGALGAKMITSIELAKSVAAPATGQRLLYAFLPRLPESPGAFSEAQLRFINGHFPEDFALACRMRLKNFLQD